MSLLFDRCFWPRVGILRVLFLFHICSMLLFLKKLGRPALVAVVVVHNGNTHLPTHFLGPDQEYHLDVGPEWEYPPTHSPWWMIWALWTTWALCKYEHSESKNGGNMERDRCSEVVNFNRSEIDARPIEEPPTQYNSLMQLGAWQLQGVCHAPHSHPSSNWQIPRMNAGGILPTSGRVGIYSL